MTTTTCFNADLYRAAMLAVAKEETRYYLNGVSVEKHPSGEGAILVAIDGEIMVCIHDADGFTTEKVIVKLSPDALRACKSGRYGIRTVEIDDAQTARVMEIGACVGIAKKCLIDGTFPDWRRIVPSKLPTKHEGYACFDAALLTRIAKVAQKLKGEKGLTPIQIFAAEPTLPALVNFNDERKSFGVIMPMRGDEMESLPAWFTWKPEK
jgi:DNA polymerase III sliding clamp (beta) subunit (PCNA family)